jgi:hypothetical protein
VVASYRCWVAHALGVKTARQLEVWGREANPSIAPSEKRALNRVYQYRRRGRTAAVDAMRKLLECENYPKACVQAFAQLFAGELTVTTADIATVLEWVLSDTRAA